MKRILIIFLITLMLIVNVVGCVTCNLVKAQCGFRSYELKGMETLYPKKDSQWCKRDCIKYKGPTIWIKKEENPSILIPYYLDRDNNIFHLQMRDNLSKIFE